MTDKISSHEVHQVVASIQLQKVLYLNAHFYPCWCLANLWILYKKLEMLESLTKFLSIAVITLSVFVEIIRLYCGYSGNLHSKVPELAGFLMSTILMQMPLVSYFLFNIYLLNTPTEVVIHTILWLMMLVEVYYGFKTMKSVSLYAKKIYLTKQN